MTTIEIIKEYCKNRELKRPKVTYFHILLYILFLIIILILYFSNFHLLNRIGGATMVYFHIYTGLIYLSLVYIWIKKMLLLLIKCYQRYASEELRRSCVCIPSCSEYSIIALTRYNLFKAIYLIIRRLTRVCKNEYIIDYPS